MSFVEVSRDGHVLSILINRPEKLNALSIDMYQDLGRALTELNDDDDLRVAVLHAAGKHFTAGIELDQWAPKFRAGKGFGCPPNQVDVFGLTGARRRKPVVMAVQGYCFTWGVEVMLNTEVRVTAEDTQFAMLEVQRGLFPCGGATIRLPQQMGLANAQRYLLTGDRWSAQEAHRTGLVQQVVPAGEQLNAALELARKIAKGAPLGVQGVMQSAAFAAQHPHSPDQVVEQLFTDLVPVMNSEDAAEGVQSFLERREATFTGR